MDFLLKFLIIGGKYITRITSQSIKEAYRRTVILGNKVNSEYEQSICVTGNSENILELYNSILDDMGNNPQHQMAFISEEHRQSFEDYLNNIETQADKNVAVDGMQLSLDEINKMQGINIEAVTDMESLHKRISLLEKEIDTSKMTIILKPHLNQQREDGINNTQEIDIEEVTGMESLHNRISSLEKEMDTSKMTIILKPHLIRQHQKNAQKNNSSLSMDNFVPKNDDNFETVKEKIVEEDLIKRCKLIEANSNELEKIAIRNLQFYTLMENRHLNKIKEEKAKHNESIGLSLIEKELMSRGFWDDVDAIDKAVIKTPTSTKKQNRIKRMISRNYLDNLQKKSMEKMKTVHVEYEENKKKANSEIFFRKQNRYKTKEKNQQNANKKNAVDKKMAVLKKKQKQEDTNIINQVSRKFELIKQREIEKCLNKQNDPVFNPEIEMQSNNEVIIDQLMQNILKKEISFVRKRVSHKELVNEEIKHTAKLIETSKSHFAIVDTALKFKQLENTIKHETLLLAVNDIECKKLERQLTSKMLEIVPNNKADKPVITLSLETDLKFKDIDIKEQSNLMDINQRVFNELEANIKIVKLINKHKSKMPSYSPKSFDNTRRSFSIRAHYRKLAQFSELSRLYCTNNKDTKVPDDEEINWEDITAFEEDKMDCKNVSTNTNDLLSNNNNLDNQIKGSKNDVSINTTYRKNNILMLLKDCQGIAMYNALFGDVNSDKSSDVSLDNPAKIANLKKILSRVIGINNSHIVKVDDTINDLQNIVAAKAIWYAKNSSYIQNRLNRSTDLEDSIENNQWKKYVDLNINTPLDIQSNLKPASKMNNKMEVLNNDNTVGRDKTTAELNKVNVKENLKLSNKMEANSSEEVIAKENIKLEDKVNKKTKISKYQLINHNVKKKSASNIVQKVNKVKASFIAKNILQAEELKPNLDKSKVEIIKLNQLKLDYANQNNTKKLDTNEIKSDIKGIKEEKKIVELNLKIEDKKRIIGNTYDKQKNAIKAIKQAVKTQSESNIKNSNLKRNTIFKPAIVQEKKTFVDKLPENFNINCNEKFAARAIDNVVSQQFNNEDAMKNIKDNLKTDQNIQHNNISKTIMKITAKKENAIVSYIGFVKNDKILEEVKAKPEFSKNKVSIQENIVEPIKTTNNIQKSVANSNKTDSTDSIKHYKTISLNLDKNPKESFEQPNMIVSIDLSEYYKSFSANLNQTQSKSDVAHTNLPKTNLIENNAKENDIGIKEDKIKINAVCNNSCQNNAQEEKLVANFKEDILKDDISKIASVVCHESNLSQNTDQNIATPPIKTKENIIHYKTLCQHLDTYELKEMDLKTNKNFEKKNELNIVKPTKLSKSDFAVRNKILEENISTTFDSKENKKVSIPQRKPLIVANQTLEKYKTVNLKDINDQKQSDAKKDCLISQTFVTVDIEQEDKSAKQNSNVDTINLIKDYQVNNLNKKDANKRLHLRQKNLNANNKAKILQKNFAYKPSNVQKKPSKKLDKESKYTNEKEKDSVDKLGYDTTTNSQTIEKEKSENDKNKASMLKNNSVEIIDNLSKETTTVQNLDKGLKNSNDKSKGNIMLKQDSIYMPADNLSKETSMLENFDKALDKNKSNFDQNNSANLISQKSKGSVDNSNQTKHKPFYIINDSVKPTKSKENSNKSEPKKHTVPNMEHIKYLSSSTPYIESSYESVDVLDKFLQQNIIIDLMNEITNSNKLAKSKTNVFDPIDEFPIETKSEDAILPHSYWCFSSEHQFYSIDDYIKGHKLQTIPPEIVKLPCGNDREDFGDEEKMLEDDIQEGDFSWLNYATGTKYSDKNIIDNIDDDLLPPEPVEKLEVTKTADKTSSKDLILHKFLPCDEKVPEHLRRRRVGMSVFNLENTSDLNPKLVDCEIGERFRSCNKKSLGTLPKPVHVDVSTKSIKSKTDHKSNFSEKDGVEDFNDKKILTTKTSTTKYKDKQNLPLNVTNIEKAKKSASRIPKVSTSKINVISKISVNKNKCSDNENAQRTPLISDKSGTIVTKSSEHKDDIKKVGSDKTKIVDTVPLQANLLVKKTETPKTAPPSAVEFKKDDKISSNDKISLDGIIKELEFKISKINFEISEIKSDSNFYNKKNANQNISKAVEMEKHSTARNVMPSPKYLDSENISQNNENVNINSKMQNVNQNNPIKTAVVETVELKPTANNKNLQQNANESKTSGMNSKNNLVVKQTDCTNIIKGQQKILDFDSKPKIENKNNFKNMLVVQKEPEKKIMKSGNQKMTSDVIQPNVSEFVSKPKIENKNEPENMLVVYQESVQKNMESNIKNLTSDANFDEPIKIYKTEIVADLQQNKLAPKTDDSMINRIVQAKIAEENVLNKTSTGDILMQTFFENKMLDKDKILNKSTGSKVLVKSDACKNELALFKNSSQLNIKEHNPNLENPSKVKDLDLVINAKQEELDKNIINAKTFSKSITESEEIRKPMTQSEAIRKPGTEKINIVATKSLNVIDSNRIQLKPDEELHLFNSKKATQDEKNLERSKDLQIETIDKNIAFQSLKLERPINVSQNALQSINTTKPKIGTNLDEKTDLDKLVKTPSKHLFNMRNKAPPKDASSEQSERKHDKLLHKIINSNVKLKSELQASKTLLHEKKLNISTVHLENNAKQIEVAKPEKLEETEQIKISTESNNTKIRAKSSSMRMRKNPNIVDSNVNLIKSVQRQKSVDSLQTADDPCNPVEKYLSIKDNSSVSTPAAYSKPQLIFVEKDYYAKVKPRQSKAEKPYEDVPEGIITNSSNLNVELKDSEESEFNTVKQKIQRYLKINSNDSKQLLQNASRNEIDQHMKQIKTSINKNKSMLALNSNIVNGSQISTEIKENGIPASFSVSLDCNLIAETKSELKPFAGLKQSKLRIENKNIESHTVSKDVLSKHLEHGEKKKNVNSNTMSDFNAIQNQVNNKIELNKLKKKDSVVCVVTQNPPTLIKNIELNNKRSENMGTRLMDVKRKASEDFSHNKTSISCSQIKNSLKVGNANLKVNLRSNESIESKKSNLEAKVKSSVVSGNNLITPQNSISMLKLKTNKCTVGIKPPIESKNDAKKIESKLEKNINIKNPKVELKQSKIKETVYNTNCNKLHLKPNHKSESAMSSKTVQEANIEHLKDASKHINKMYKKLVKSNNENNAVEEQGTCAQKSLTKLDKKTDRKKLEITKLEHISIINEAIKKEDIDNMIKPNHNENFIRVNKFTNFEELEVKRYLDSTPPKPKTPEIPQSSEPERAGPNISICNQCTHARCFNSPVKLFTNSLWNWEMQAKCTKNIPIEATVKNQIQPKSNIFKNLQGIHVKNAVQLRQIFNRSINSSSAVKNQAPKTYRYETKIVQSASGKPVKITYLVEQPHES